jgi:MFS transporter, DHA2 family, multidrug resistance protein
MKQPSKYMIAWTAAFGMFMGVLDSTIVNVALVPMSVSLKADLGSIQWVITAYFLVLAGVIPIAGYLGNRYGIKRFYLICLALFTLGSMLCGFAPSLEWLIIFRVIQGFGGGGLFPLAQTIALGAFQPQERASASAIIGTSALLAPILGPTVGGLLTDTLGWQYIFFVNLPIGLVALFMVWRIVPSDPVRNAKTLGRFDFIGLVLVVSGTLLIVYAFTLVSEIVPGSVSAQQPRGDVYGWGYWLVWLLMGLGIALLAIFAFYELRVSDPVLDLRLFKDYAFTTASLVTLFVAMAIFGSFYLLPVFLQQVRTPSFTALETGLVLLPAGIASTIAVMLSGKFFYNRWGARNLLVMGSVFLIVGTWGLTNLTPQSDFWALLFWIVIRGFGFGFTFVPSQTRAMQEIAGAALPKASSLLNILRQIFSSIGTAITATLFLQQTNVHIRELQGGQTANIGTQAATMAVNDVFFLVTIASVIVLFLSFAVPGRMRPKPTLASIPLEPEQALTK